MVLCPDCAHAADSLLVALGLGILDRSGQRPWLSADRSAWHRAQAALHRRHEAGRAEVTRRFVPSSGTD